MFVSSQLKPRHGAKDISHQSYHPSYLFEVQANSIEFLALISLLASIALRWPNTPPYLIHHHHPAPIPQLQPTHPQILTN